MAYDMSKVMFTQRSGEIGSAVVVAVAGTSWINWAESFTQILLNCAGLVVAVLTAIYWIKKLRK